jgi:hypothetical protein
MSALIKTSTSITMYIPVGLKMRIEKAAQLDERSVSQYMTRILERLVPPIDQPALQVDLEELIAKRVEEDEKDPDRTKQPHPYKAQAQRIVKAVSRKPRRGK